MKPNRLYFLFLITLSLASCREFIEPSLSNKKIYPLAPADKTEMSYYQITFWWETHPDALKYRLQVVSPSFNAAQKIILDTLVNADKFTYTLDPGSYEWRIRAENGSSQTPFVTQSFIVHPAALTDQSVQVSAPANQLYTNNALTQYEWLKLFGATGYRLQVDKNNFSNEQNLILNVTTDNLSYSYTLPSEGVYQMRVRAENATQNSKWSTVRTLTFDATPPAQVNLSTPANKATVSKPVGLSWGAITDAVQYEVAVYQSDSTTLYHSSYPQILSTTNHSFTLGNSGETLVWRVRAIDRAGNKGNWSSFYTFTIQ